MAQRYRQRPSEMMGLPPQSWSAWLVDAACVEAGRAREDRQVAAAKGQGGILFPIVDARG